MDRREPTARPLVVALDGDDTLWHNEVNFQNAYARFRALVAPHVDAPEAEIDALLLATERRNLSIYGYGIKGFVLSMLETALDATGDAMPASDLRRILDLGREMTRHPVEPIDGAASAIEALRVAGHEVWLVTKGDLFDQESKIARSGLAPLFDRIEIVAEKDEATYARLLDRHGVAVERFVMAGNSLRSDVVPVLRLGARAFHVPHDLTWAHEADADPAGLEIESLASLADLPAALAAP